MEGNLSYSICRCTHLTNFAILMQVVPLEVRAGRRGVPGFEEVPCLPWAAGGGRVACVTHHCPGGLVREAL